MLAREHGEDGIRVNTVLPGHVWGPSLEWWFEHLAKKQGTTPQEVYDSVADEAALRRIPTSAEIADAVVFFASDLSRVVTGQSLDVNAGSWLRLRRSASRCRWKACTCCSGCTAPRRPRPSPSC